uniref:Ion transport domain-containing protein n=1 Tax=Romanomermis culicivorax TaxID=13658 RepID=A0A915K176_ROMCU
MIVVFSLWEIAEGGGGSLSVLRTFRLLRILKLVRFMPALRYQLVVMLRTMDNVTVFFGLLCLFIFIFSLLGMVIFGGRFCINKSDGSQCTCKDLRDPKITCICARKNFDNFLHSSLTVFQILTQEDWNVVLFNGMAHTSPWAALYFVALMTFGNYVLFNLLVAILVEGFQESKEEERRLLEEEEKKKAEEVEENRKKEEEYMLYKTPSQNAIIYPLIEGDDSGEPICTCSYRSAADRDRLLSLPAVLYSSPLQLQQPLLVHPVGGSGVDNDDKGANRSDAFMQVPPHIIQTAPTPQHSPHCLARTLDNGLTFAHCTDDHSSSPAGESHLDGLESNSSVNLCAIFLFSWAVTISHLCCIRVVHSTDDGFFLNVHLLSRSSVFDGHSLVSVKSFMPNQSKSSDQWNSITNEFTEKSSPRVTYGSTRVSLSFQSINNLNADASFAPCSGFGLQFSMFEV